MLQFDFLNKLLDNMTKELAGKPQDFLYYINYKKFPSNDGLSFDMCHYFVVVSCFSTLENLFSIFKICLFVVVVFT